MQSRRYIILGLLVAVALLGIILFANVRPSQLLSISAPRNSASKLQADISSTLSSVSATAQAKEQAAAVQTRTLLQNPRYTGQDSLGRSWTLTAASAGQEGTATSGTYILQKVEAMWADPSRTTPFTVTAVQGRYHPAANSGTGNLELLGDVVANGMGFTLMADQIDADLATRELKGSGGTRVRGNAGSWNLDMTAPNLSAENNGNRLTLTGGVHAILTPTKASK